MVLPFHMDGTISNAQGLKSLDHSWKGAFADWAEYDSWIRHKSPQTMGHFVRGDIPFYHALADAFTIGDQYFCSIHGPTNPNRMFLFSGTSGLSVGDDRLQAVDNADDGNWTADMARDKADFPGAARWTTYAERLEAAGISWQVYQEYENFGDNSLPFFASFRGWIAPRRSIAGGGRGWPDRARRPPKSQRRNTSSRPLPGRGGRQPAAGFLDRRPRALFRASRGAARLWRKPDRAAARGAGGQSQGLGQDRADPQL
jgi:hypothetical protein